MSLTEVRRIRRWLHVHGSRRPLELCAWELVLGLWLLAWLGLPVWVLTDSVAMLPLSFVAMLLPTLYIAWRVHLHRRGQLRCDWLNALA
ncbi:MAG: hypothetical protein JO369_07580 [Paucibacter sp.]|nr:hypothetical protein [Roseateles sp.]